MNKGIQAEPFDIFWVAFREEDNGTSIIYKTRPALIVNNNTAAKVSPVLTVLPLSTASNKVGKRFPYHVAINEVKKLEGSVLLTEQITTVPKSCILGKPIAKIESNELKKLISQTLIRQLGLIV